MRRTLTLMACLATFTPCAAQQANVADLLALADPAIQAQIRTTATAFLSGGRSESEVKSNWKGFRELETLRRLAGDDEQLAKQLASYAVVEPRVEEQQVLEVLLLLQVLDLKPGIPIRILAPYLASDNKLLRGFVHDWFESHAVRSASGAPRELRTNYKDYLDYINRMLNMNEEVPTAFVDFMFVQSPEQALLVYLRVDRRDETIARLRAMRESFDARREGRAAPAIPKPQPDEQHREIRLAARLVGNAIWFAENGHDARLQAVLPEVNDLLVKLAAHDQWWVRLYVAEIMRQHRELRQADVLEKLIGDDNELVSKAAKAASYCKAATTGRLD